MTAYTQMNKEQKNTENRIKTETLAQRREERKRLTALVRMRERERDDKVRSERQQSPTYYERERREETATHSFTASLYSLTAPKSIDPSFTAFIPSLRTTVSF